MRSPIVQQQVRFCRASDGVRIAYAVHGSGPPLVVSTCWLSHLQHDWQSPVWRHFLEDLGRFATIIRYDERGFGLSDWEVDDFCLDARVSDLAAVVDDLGLEQFALMAMSQGGPVAISYAVRNPERVTRMMFYNSYAAPFPDPSPNDLAMQQAFLAMMKVGWARPQSEFRRVFTSMMIPGATDEQMSWLDELQRVSVSTENAMTAFVERAKANSVAELAQIQVPTLVLHARGDKMNEFADGIFLASNIAGARLVGIEQQQSHHSQRGACLAGRRRRGRTLHATRTGPGAAHRRCGRRAFVPRAGSPSIGGRRTRQQRDCHGPGAQCPYCRAAPAEHLREAGGHREDRPCRRRREATHRQLSRPIARSRRQRFE